MRWVEKKNTLPHNESILNKTEKEWSCLMKSGYPLKPLVQINSMSEVLPQKNLKDLTTILKFDARVG